MTIQYMRTDYRLPLLIAGAVLLISIAVFRSHLPYMGDSYLLRKPPAIVLAMDDVYLVGIGGKSKLWSLKARKVEIGQDRNTATLSGISHGKIFDKGKTILNVQAGRAVYDERRKDLRLSRGIELEGTEGQRIGARAAHWNSHTAILRSASRVTFNGAWGSVSGDNLVVDLRKKQMVMRNVSFRVGIEKLEREIRGKGGT